MDLGVDDLHHDFAIGDDLLVSQMDDEILFDDIFEDMEENFRRKYGTRERHNPLQIYGDKRFR